uniref:Uncharacterized protein n=1 Tax=Cacopsylla melanoneura TaxID=428564 RepID=A0A8D8ZAU1_9HEMI
MSLLGSGISPSLYHLSLSLSLFILQQLSLSFFILQKLSLSLSSVSSSRKKIPPCHILSLSHFLTYKIPPSQHFSYTYLPFQHFFLPFLPVVFPSYLIFFPHFFPFST